MARIRTIKPEFPQSETIGRLSREARLLFIQLWTIVDDDGRARASSRMLASLLYPYDDDAPSLMTGWLDELEHEHCIRRYSVDGASYVDIPNWLKHQKIDRPSQSRIPSFDEGSRILASVQRGFDADLGPRTLDHGPSIIGVSLRSTPSDDLKISENLPIEKPKKARPKSEPELTDEEIIQELSPWLNRETSIAFIDSRRRQKCPHTPFAVRLLCADLAKCRDPTSQTHKAILNKWKTVYPEQDNGINGSGQGGAAAYGAGTSRNGRQSGGISAAASRVIARMQGEA